MPSSIPIKISTGIYGLLPESTVGLILGRSSLTTKRIIVLPGVIDSDLTGEIQVVLHSPIHWGISGGHNIAQLLLLPYIKTKTKNETHQGRFGSTNPRVFWATPTSNINLHLK